MPFSAVESINDEDLMFKLLVANGMDLKEFKFTGAISAGMSQEVKLAACHMKDGSIIDILIKVNKDESNGIAG